MVARKFWRNPDHAPQNACLQAIKPVHFQVHYIGNPPLETKWFTDLDTNLSTQVLAEWHTGKHGFFLRDSSFLDITEIGFQSSQTPVAAWLEYLEREFYGKRGFDRPPELVGEYHAGEMN